MESKKLNLIYSGYSGSILYGTNTIDSDVDIRSVCLDPIESIIGLSLFEQFITPIGDNVTYGLRKFVHLALTCNPSMIEILWSPLDGPTHIFHSSEWLQIVKNRRSFLNSHGIAKSFQGYAISQLKRIETHFRWMTGKPPVEPHFSDFGGVKKVDGGVQWPNNDRQNAYANAHKVWTQYQDWIKNRNPNRHALELKFGYDSKHAMHLVRLYEQGLELLTTGGLTLPRSNASELLNIRNNGRYTYDELLEWVEIKDAEIEEAEENSVLPAKSDFDTVQNMVMGIYKKYIGDYIRYE